MIEFIVGIFVGLVLGVAIMAVMSAGQYNKGYSDAIDWATAKLNEEFKNECEWSK